MGGASFQTVFCDMPLFDPRPEVGNDPPSERQGVFPVVAQFPTLLRRPGFCFPASSFHLPSPARPRALEASGISLHRWH